MSLRPSTLPYVWSLAEDGLIPKRAMILFYHETFTFGDFGGRNGAFAFSHIVLHPSAFVSHQIP